NTASSRCQRERSAASRTSLSTIAAVARHASSATSARIAIATSASTSVKPPQSLYRARLEPACARPERVMSAQATADVADKAREHVTGLVVRCDDDLDFP